MTLLSEAATRFAHAKSESSWEILFPDPTNGGEITRQTEVAWVHVSYTDFDGAKTTQVFDHVKDAFTYTQTVEDFWGYVKEANKLNDKIAKDLLYQHLVDKMGGQVEQYGEDFLPHDIKKAINEIKEYFIADAENWAAAA